MVFEPDDLIAHYKLEGKVAVRCKTLLEWAEWFQTADRRVAETTIDDFWISTVFLGLDHSFNFSDEPHDPLLFETMVFLGKNEDTAMWRYFTWEEAEEGHKKAVEIIKAQTQDAGFLAADILGELRAKIKTV